jgi:hypothetical protein
VEIPLRIVRAAARSQRSRRTQTHQRVDGNRLVDSAEARHLDGVHVEHVDALELAEELETLETGGLFDAVM